jgi:hypothetical protein
MALERKFGFAHVFTSAVEKECLLIRTRVITDISKPNLNHH